MNTTTGRDWFTHSAFVPAIAARQVNQQLDAYTATITAYVATREITDVRICVSGSLARGEPAVRRTDAGDYELASDVDLVAITETTADPGHPIHALVGVLRRDHPRIDTTLYTVRRSDLPRVAGRFGVDLHRSARRPVVGLPISGFDPPSLGHREGLEGLVHQLAAVYAHDDPAATPWRVKTVLEALRAFAPGGSTPQCYTHLSTGRDACLVLERHEIENLIRAREYALELPLNPQRAYSCVVRAAAHLLEVPATEPVHPGLLAALQRNVGCRLHVLNGFQLAVLATTIVSHGAAMDCRYAAAALHVIVSHIDPDTLPTARRATVALARISPVDLTRGGSHVRHVVHAHMQALRADYYHWLGPHNFGAAPAAGYLSPTSRVETTAGIRP